MARGKKAQVPGEAPEPQDERAAKTPRAKAAAPAAEAQPMHPAVERAMEGADKMTYAKAQALDAEGKLGRKVLTEQGWYIPNSSRPVE